MNSIEFQNDLFYYRGRFSPFTIKRGEFYSSPQLVGTKTALCHRISFYTIVAGIKNALNYYIHFQKMDGIDADDCIVQSLGFIAGMILSVQAEKIPVEAIEELKGLRGMPNENPEKGKMQKEFNKKLIALVSEGHYGVLLNDLGAAMTEMFPLKESCLQRESYGVFLAERASSIVDILNNEQANLRLGAERWNTSLQNAYDPETAVYETNGQKERFLIQAETDNIQITNLLAFTMAEYQEVEGTENALFFLTAKIPAKEQTAEHAFLYSSMLPEAQWMKVDCLEECGIPVFYYDYIFESEQQIIME